MTVAEEIYVGKRPALEVCPECGRKPKRVTAGKCGACYERQRRGGPERWAPLDPEIKALLLAVPGASRTFARRVFSYVDASGDCWQWLGTTNTWGYGVIKRGGKGTSVMGAHCAVWELLVGPIPSDLVFDHLCRNRLCVNPDHGEIVPIAVNVMRGYGPSRLWSERETCLKGHQLDGVRCHRGRTSRYCKTCSNEQKRARYVPKAQREAQAAA